ncbi:hypothetical protein B296_00018344 [Ensete ventricosum]|uniref:Non-reducing end beta-L-arabinofuranosidase-like GH127 catalytic domain-containing protein n=1 Tax=Ensete ventricosum TaxID=4639 RepID=A0A426ZW68_ENSVE|nr:hypothetical protein B296_00018344 [Ensete ventricosum]
MAIAAAMAFFPAAANRCTDRIFDVTATVAHYQLLGRNRTTEVDSLSRYHLNPHDESTWMNVLPRKAGQPVVTELDWAMLYRAVKRPGLKSAANASNFLKEIPLSDVRIEPSSVHGRAQQTNLEYLLLLDVDRLVWSFRKLAGLPTPGEPYLGWEEPKGQLRGHFVGDELALKPILPSSSDVNICIRSIMCASFSRPLHERNSANVGGHRERDDTPEDERSGRRPRRVPEEDRNGLSLSFLHG